MKITAASLKQMIKEELGKDDRVALDNLTAAVEALVQNHGYTIEDVIDVVAAEEGSGVSIAMRGDEEVSMRDIAEDQELEECGYPEEEEEEPKRYFEI